jgi:hypothetical protein
MSDIFRYINGHMYSPEREPETVGSRLNSDAINTLSKIKLKRFMKKIMRQRYPLSERMDDSVRFINLNLNSYDRFTDFLTDEIINDIL